MFYMANIVVSRLEKAKELEAMLEIENLELDMTQMVPRLPEVDDTHFPLKISYVSRILFAIIEILCGLTFIREKKVCIRCP